LHEIHPCDEHQYSFQRIEGPGCFGSGDLIP
jgi:hypothetical protein